jgi:diguanylate cyclase (GGDEF)-like protein
MILFLDRCFHLTAGSKNFVYIKRPGNGENVDGIIESTFESNRPEAETSVMRSIAQNYIAGVSEKYFNDHPNQRKIIEDARKMDEVIEVAVRLAASYLVENFGNYSEIAKNVPEDMQDYIAKGVLGSISESHLRREFGSICTIYIVREQLKVEPMTGLFNQNAFKHEVNMALERCRRHEERNAMLLIDIDHFKSVNDEHGHTVGDQVIVEFARRLVEEVHFRPLDILSRYGGEEFGVLMPHTSSTGALITSLRVHEALQQPFRVQKVVNGGNGESKTIDLDLAISASIGVGQRRGTKRGEQADDYIQETDRNLYILKGKKPDRKGIEKSRRGKVACNGRILEWHEVERIKRKRERLGIRESSALPPAVKVDPDWDAGTG